MAKCDLSIEFEKAPEYLHHGGGTIRGKVHVQVDQDVNCNGLVVQSVWRTHGRGNIATGTAGETTLFQGQWIGGQKLEYPFELPIADWPPSYHGNYLNVDHYIDARANIPWAFDPKTSAAFRMRPTCGPEKAVVQTAATPASGIFGCIFLFGFAIVFLGVFAAGAATIVPLLFFAGFGVIGLGIYLFRNVLPKVLLGNVRFELSPTTVAPGDKVQGELILQPRKDVRINAITMTFEAREECVSGSGSNRTTHKHPFFSQAEVLQEATTLRTQKAHRFPVSVKLPDDAPYSIDLKDNQLIWSTRIRIDIPRWPDWTQEIALQVLPSGKPQQPPIAAALVESPDAASDDTITFSETAQHLWTVRNQPQQLATLVQAVTGLSFTIEAVVERRLLYAGRNAADLVDDGHAVWARGVDPPLPMVLYVPSKLADDFQRLGREPWTGQGMIVGWDDQHERLQIKVLE